MDGEEWSGRSDSGYSNTSSPRGSTLTLHPAAPSPPAADHTRPPRPLSAPGHLPLVPRLVLPNQSTHTQTDTPPASAQSQTPKSSIPRPAKPTPPPKPASIRRAVSNLTRRPTSIPCKSRGWSGAKTTPTTPVTTPTHSAKPRLPSARTPRSSGRSTPNTTPTTPTHCRRYMTSLQRAPAPRPVSTSRPTSRPSSKPPSRSPSICSRLQECYNTVQSESVNEAHRTDLDNKVLDIASQTRGYCGCKEVDCTKSHVKRVADGKYEICGRNVYVRQNSSPSEKFAQTSQLRKQPSSKSHTSCSDKHCHTVEEFVAKLQPRETSSRISHSPPVYHSAKKSALRQRHSDSPLRKVHFSSEPNKCRIPVTTTATASTSIDPYLLKGKHVMVRVGGGWDTLEHYLLRHDPKQVTVFNLKSADPFLHIRAKYCSPTQSQASSTRGSPTLPSHTQ
ncbi:uncharacterized protein [Procambarus clarkii]|uniref:uncharacterized protein n=1 Tax=Procambarus clarkii TaxID=6728 RepID=UPI0037426F82